MKTREITVDSPGRGARDITAECERLAAEASAGGDGLLQVFIPHSTAGVVIMELGAGTEEDLMAALDAILPRDDRWVHRDGARGHGADHVLPLLSAPSITVPVIDGRLALGTWQSIVLVDPNPDKTERRARLSFIPG